MQQNGPKVMRKLALDIGSKNIGISVSDPTNILAQPLTTIERSTLDKEAQAIKALVEEYEINEVIAGLPVDLKGQQGVAAKNIEDYLKMLEKAIGMDIKRFDERLTTKMAEDILKAAGLKKNKRKKIIDELAATIILQTYLEHEKKT